MTTTPSPSINVIVPTGAAVGPWTTGWTYEVPEDVWLYIETDGVAGNDLVDGVDFTLTATNPALTGGSVTLAGPSVPVGGWTAAHRVILRRWTARRQGVALPDTEGHKPRATEKALDRAMRIAEEQTDEMDLVVKVNPGETPPSAEDVRNAASLAAQRATLTLDNVDEEEARANLDLLSATELAAGGGAEAIGDRRPEAGSPTRTVYAAVRTIPYIDEFRWDADPPDDWSLALARYKNSTADRVRFPADKGAVRNYPISTAHSVGSNAQFEGGHKWTARFIKTGSPTGPILDLNAVSNSAVRDLHFRYENQPATSTNAVAIKVTNSQTCTFENIWLANVGDGWVGIGGGNHKLRNIDCYGYEDTAVHFAAGCLDSQLDVFNFYAGDSIKGRFGGLRFAGGVEACTASRGEIKLGVNAITTANYGSATRGSAPFACGVSNVRLDSSKGPAALLRSGLHFSILDSWIASAGHNYALGYDEAEDAAGIDADQMKHLLIMGCRFVNNGGRGATFYNNNRHTKLIGNTFAQNGYTRDYDVAAAEFLAGSQRFVAQGNTCEFIDGPEIGFASGSFRQNIGISVQAGCDYFDVSGNSLGGCTGFNASPAAVNGSYERNW